MKTAIAFILSLVITACGNSNAVAACSLIDGQVDYDCNGKLKMVFLGDSIVYGIKGTPAGGYVSRLKGRFPRAELVNNGIPGITSLQLLANLKQGKYSNILQADYVFVAVGTNDYWSKVSPSYTANNIKRITDQIRSMYSFSGLNSPIIKVMTLTPTTRSYQKGFVASVNASIRQYGLTGPDMSTLPTYQLDSDGLHPNSSGYNTLAYTVYAYINGIIRTEALKGKLNAKRKR